MKLNVLDAICGYGKSVYFTESITSSPDDYSVVMVPSLAEVGRYTKECNKNLPEDKQLTAASTEEHDTKSEHIETLLTEKKSFVCTHHMYERITPAMCSLAKKMHLKRGKKVLYLDETIELVGVSKMVSAEDMKLLHKRDKYIDVNETTGLVSWVSKHVLSGYEHVKNACDNGQIYYLADKYIVFDVPVDWLLAFDEVYVATYRFKYSPMYHYLKSNGIEVNFIDSGADRKNKLKDQYRKRIKVLDDITIKRHRLSKSGYDYDPSGVKREINRCVQEAMNQTDTPLDKTLVTFYKHFDGKNQLKYWFEKLKIGEKINGPFIEMQKGEKVEVYKSCYIPWNTIGTNDYRDKELMIFNVHPHINPGVLQYLSERGQSLDKKGWALNACIQWLFRGCVRDHEAGTMYIAIPDKELREAFKMWLQMDEVESKTPVVDIGCSKLRARKYQDFKKLVNQNPQCKVYSYEEYLEHGGAKLKQMAKKAA